MSNQPQDGDFCLECHWEGFHIDGKASGDSSGSHSQSQWECSQPELHTALANNKSSNNDCCEAEDCALDCGSGCEGLADCDASTVCSVAQCDETHCENTDPACFEDHCCDDTNDQDCAFDSFFGLNTPLSLDTSGLLPPTAPVMAPSLVDDQGKSLDPTLPGAIDPCYHQDFLHSYQSHASHCEQNVASHFECDDFQRDLQGMFTHQPFPQQTEVNPQDVFQMLGMCPDYTVCHDHVSPPQPSASEPEKPAQEEIPLGLNCFHPEHHHVHGSSHGSFKNPNDLNLHIPRGPLRNHHRCRVHHHHSHPYSPYSRHSRSSISSHFMSSPGETPPPLDGGISSVLTTPDFSAEDSDFHTCKWVVSINGIKAPCGITFTDSGALQDHLVSTHMNTVDGAKGNGYYCCWEGCHRPDEPFSQKSKLQGHFLTHSNYKNFRCSVCGKSFARQATLDRHERSHRGDKPYRCKDCGKTFTDSSELKTHSRTHSGEKPFQCTFPGCNFTTGDSSNMSSHRLTHGERKHKCLYPGCTKSFTRPDQLKRHQRTTHKTETSSLLSPSPEHFALTPFGVI
ncbi:hypothetical protein N7509_012353 [Penicillium cosmopolitanum]|uniref:C2H2-type domain-containing protein n=1 Tax=Penicillium cosmopolitanum TaxID=1131564 RepID=A0A9W9SL31_9EURO|nr:uncharacterized protein N7509_012353 [Penicillium cosmopolitanum]KAJ5379234.1 hypothetical protein N7509_012353 [Penicillium cosmopolitanum]